MRKRRAIIFNSEPTMTGALKLFLDARGYETMLFETPQACPVIGECAEGGCARACADVFIVVDNLATATGVDLLLTQERQGCRIAVNNKAIISRSLPMDQRKMVGAIGWTFFHDARDYGALEDWIRGCETRMDLALPLATRRRAERKPCEWEVQYRFGTEAVMRRAVAVNMSAGGICLKTPHSLKPNQSLSLWLRTPGFSEEARVRWVKEMGNGSYLAGLSFLP